MTDHLESASRMLLSWQAHRASLENPAFRRDVCFICERAPRQVSAPGSPVGTCTACHERAMREEAT